MTQQVIKGINNMAKANKANKVDNVVTVEEVVVQETIYPTDEAMVKDGMETLSSRIRHLESLGCKTSQIAKIVKRSNGEHPRYQHVRNVLITPLKRDMVVETEAAAAVE